MADGRHIFRCHRSTVDLNQGTKMFRIARPVARLLYRPSPSTRAFTAAPGVFVDKRKVDQLLNPLSQKYADAKDEVILKSLRLTKV